MKILEAEGIHFVMNAEIDPERLPEGFDAYCICIGTPTPRDLKVPGRELKGVYFASMLFTCSDYSASEICNIGTNNNIKNTVKKTISMRE